MNIGFVGIILDKEKDIKMKSCILKNANKDNLKTLIKHNIQIMNLILDYLIEHHIKLFRMSSGFIPFASHPINKLRWWSTFKEVFEKIGERARKNNIRLSLHPGQYTILNSPDKNLVNKSIKDLEYHTKLLDTMQLPSSSKIVLHVGGVYDNKEASLNRFIQNYQKLSNNIKARLVLENDEKCYNTEDVLYLSKKLHCPVIFDYLHFLINHKSTDWLTLLNQCRKTWKKKDGQQIIHYSQQAIGKKIGSHSLTINPIIFDDFAKLLPNDIDVMFEVKDKNISVLNYFNYKKRID